MVRERPNNLARMRRQAAFQREMESVPGGAPVIYLRALHHWSPHVHISRIF